MNPPIVQQFIDRLGLAFVTFHDGRIARFRQIFDSAAMLES